MILDSRDKLRAIQRSLETVVIPAIPEGAAQALEQAQFAAMHCRMMLEQVDWDYAMEVAEAGHFASLCRDLGGDDPLIARAEAFAAGPPTSHSHVRATVLDLRALADRLLEAALASGDRVRAAAAAAAVIEAARRHEVRTRAWVQDASYETGDVPAATIAESLDPARLDHLLA